MSAVLAGPRPAGGYLAHALAAWRSLRARELVWFSLIGLLYGVIDLSSLLEVKAGGLLPQLILRHLLVPWLYGMVLLLVWLPVERSSAGSPQRNARLAAATVLGTLLGMLLICWLLPLLPWPSIDDLMRAEKGMPPRLNWRWNGLLGDMLSVLMPAALMVTTFELRQRHRRSELAMQALLTEQSQLRRRAMAARLAALQAQVEPQLLFDALVDIERAYRSDSGEAQGAATARLERLIRHLRVALPRLRESGSTLEAETELLDSYLQVLADLQPQPQPPLQPQAQPQPPPLCLHADWPPALAGRSVPAMLLLPLLQRVLRLAPQTPPRHCTLRAEQGDAGPLRLTLGFDRPGLCGEDAELRALDERLRVLAGTAARLHCVSSASETLFTVELPP
ncbi:MAG: histidine kinase [Burkholderiaceae bacterium]